MKTPSIFAVDLRLSPRRAELLRRTVGLFGFLLVAVTWPLWTPQTVFPQVPLFRAALHVSNMAQWGAAGAMLAGLFGMLVLPAGRLARAALLLFAAGTASLVVMDQQRLQPWAYQFVLLAVVLAIAPARSALVLVRVFIVGFYFESAITKLDYSFLHTLGQQFLQTLVGFVGVSIEAWPLAVRLAAAAVFPLGELLVALGLWFTGTRRIALYGAIGLHVLLLVILGPWGLDHKPGVLAWNAFFIVQDVLLFWTPRRATANATGSIGARRAPSPAVALVAAAVLLPLLEPWGWFDMWPSWGLYASSAERVVLQIHRQGRHELPDSLERYLEAPEDPAEPWLTLRLDRWSLGALGAPIYPQNRVQLGIAQAVVGGGGWAQRARTIRLSRADRWTGERTSTIIQGAAQWNAVGGEYFFNTLPRQNVR